MHLSWTAILLKRGCAMYCNGARKSVVNVWHRKLTRHELKKRTTYMGSRPVFMPARACSMSMIPDGASPQIRTKINKSMQQSNQQSSPWTYSQDVKLIEQRSPGDSLVSWNLTASARPEVSTRIGVGTVACFIWLHVLMWWVTPSPDRCGQSVGILSCCQRSKAPANSCSLSSSALSCDECCDSPSIALSVSAQSHDEEDLLDSSRFRSITWRTRIDANWRLETPIFFHHFFYPSLPLHCMYLS
jgi:hypothetical protein